MKDAHSEGEDAGRADQNGRGMPSRTVQLCPRCHTPLLLASEEVYCSSCGFSSPIERPPSRARRSASADSSSVWIDPAYMRHNYVSERAHHTPPPVSSSPSAASSPIPPRASREAQQKGATPARVRPKYSYASRDASADITRVPTIPQARQSAQSPVQSQQASPVWQYESPDYEIESSISSLSLVVSEQPTRPEIEQPAASSTCIPDLPTRPEIEQPAMPSPFIPDLPTKPEPVSPSLSLNEIVTQPPPPVVLSNVAERERGPRLNDAPTLAVVPANQTHLMVPEHVSGALSSWTAGGAAESAFARRIADPSRRKQPKISAIKLNPLDRVRWWLLHPGRIEFVLWLVGAVLLIFVTCVFFLTTAFSFGWITTGPLSHLTSSDSNGASASQHPLPTVVTSSGLKLSLEQQGPLLAGQAITLRGKGFSHNGHIVLTYDRWQPFTGQAGGQGGTGMVQANEQGAFTVRLVLGTGAGWYAGMHQIEARDLVTGHLAAVRFMISTGPMGKGGSSTASSGRSGTPSSSHGTPGTQATPGTPGTPGTGPGNIPTPVGQTPVPITPTATVPASPTPSPTPTQPPATPTPVTPTPATTPPAGTTPTPGTSGSTDSTSGLLVGVSAPLMTGNMPAGPWLWLVIPGSALALLLLGLAGVLRKHRQ